MVTQQSRAPVTLSAVADASGNATIAFRSRGPNIYEITQIGITMPGAGSVIGQCYFNGSPVSPFFPPDTIGGPPSQLVGPGDELTLVVTGAAAGKVLIGAFYYNQLIG